MERIEINVQTGEQNVIPLTPEEIAAIQASQPTTAELMEQLRTRRNQLLTETDWTQSRDVTLSNDTEWAAYRQALRDLPANTEDPANPVWPTKPS